MTKAEQVQYWDNKSREGGFEIEIAFFRWERDQALWKWKMDRRDEGRSFWIPRSDIVQSPTLSIGGE